MDKGGAGKLLLACLWFDSEAPFSLLQDFVVHCCLELRHPHLICVSLWTSISAEPSTELSNLSSEHINPAMLTTP